MKVIPTIYKGYRFRSRLEARWAVFFDNLEINWEYEKEGYELKHGWYLPDFWLPYQFDWQLFDWQLNEYPNSGEWFEIKGKKITREEELLALDLSKETKHSTNIIQGSPWNMQEWFKTHNKGFNNYIEIDNNSFLTIFGLTSKFSDFSMTEFYVALNRAKQADF